tara:strand:- start:851 stop:1567 length:717 start_codon:yes stop_codon:yes gene_type:complete
VNTQKKILVFTATYNEVDNIVDFINSVRNQSKNLDVLIIDDNSPDNTALKIRNLQKEIENLKLIVRDNKKGLDSAHKMAYDYAIKKNYNYLITMDADFSHDPSELNNFVKKLEDSPFVIGSRYVKGGKCLMTGSRLVMSKIGNKLIKYVSGIKCNEFTTSYRGFNLDKLKGFHLNLVTTKGYSFFMGTMFVIQKMKFEIKEIPIIFKDREKGISKIPKIEIFRTLTNLIILTFKNKLN